MKVYVLNYTEDHESHGYEGIFRTPEKAKAFLPHLEWEDACADCGMWAPWLFQAQDGDTLYTIKEEELDPPAMGELAGDFDD